MHQLFLVWCDKLCLCEISPQKEIHGREVRGTRRVFNGTPSSNPCVWKSCIEVSSCIVMVVGRCTHTLTVANILSFLLMELSLVRDTLTCFKSLLVHKLLRSLVITARFTFSKMEHLPTTIAMHELTSMQLFQTHGLDEGVPLNTLRVPRTSRPWISFCGDISQRQSLSHQTKNN